MEWRPTPAMWKIFSFAEHITVDADGSAIAWISGMNPYCDLINLQWTTDVPPPDDKSAQQWNHRAIEKIDASGFGNEWWMSAKWINEEHACDHCWHSTGMTLLSSPPQSWLVCCWCGEIKVVRQAQIAQEKGEHGSHIDPPYVLLGEQSSNT